MLYTAVDCILCTPPDSCPLVNRLADQNAALSDNKIGKEAYKPKAKVAYLLEDHFGVVRAP
jgi:hypothetical protein